MQRIIMFMCLFSCVAFAHDGTPKLVELFGDLNQLTNQPESYAATYKNAHGAIEKIHFEESENTKKPYSRLLHVITRAPKFHVYSVTKTGDEQSLRMLVTQKAVNFNQKDWTSRFHGRQMQLREVSILGFHFAKRMLRQINKQELMIHLAKLSGRRIQQYANGLNVINGQLVDVDYMTDAEYNDNHFGHNPTQIIGYTIKDLGLTFEPVVNLQKDHTLLSLTGVINAHHHTVNVKIMQLEDAYKIAIAMTDLRHAVSTYYHAIYYFDEQGRRETIRRNMVSEDVEQTEMSAKNIRDMSQIADALHRYITDKNTRENKTNMLNAVSKIVKQR